ncbi:SCO2584 family spore wall biosynthesis protein [Yinghuangia soli]|uniref:Uncharacterized protein n=1 Tax=Yinghuangia soli TaxID=2908204 RepID=A0AA41U2H1_9ACTN|nr:hypothetical protein [Yinghuangia soli]MCF2530686.1 hypothetical protein [Yinghuangia soli]
MSDSRGPEPPEGLPEFGENPDPAEDELSSVVFDEHFVRAASIHEPSAAERQQAAAPRPKPPAPQPGTLPDDPFLFHEPRAVGGFRPGGAHIPMHGDEGGLARTARWRQSVAWVLALLMGVGVVAMAITAVAPGRSGQDPIGPQPSVGSPVPPPEERLTAGPAGAAGAGPCATSGPVRSGC